jgi:hypothetical protein
MTTLKKENKVKTLRRLLIKWLKLKQEIVVRDEAKWHEHDEAQLAAFLKTETGKRMLSRLRFSAMELALAGHPNYGQGIMMAWSGIRNMSITSPEGRNDDLFSYEIDEDNAQSWESRP